MYATNVLLLEKKGEIVKEIRPMGAKALPKGDKGKQKLAELYANSRYVAEKKFDGSRYVLQNDKGNIILTSRRESVRGGMCEKSANVPHIIAELKDKFCPGIILDGEIDIRAGREFHFVQGTMGSLPDEAIRKQKDKEKLVYKVFDILEYQYEDVRNKTLAERRAILESLFKRPLTYIILVEQFKDKDKRDLFDKEIEAGAEGIILKNLDSVYVEDKKPTNSWYKLKLVDTFDGIVTGYNAGTGKYEGMIGSLKVCQYKDKQLIEVAECGGMTDELRKAFKVRLDRGEKFIIEFAAQETEGNNRYRHPRFVRERTDKNASQCIYGEK
jgi:DNA ligase-1